MSSLGIEHEGDIGVLREMLELAEARRRGAECAKRPALMVLAGIMRGVYGAGGVRALERAGLRDGVYAALGVSTGAPTVAYFLAGQAGVGTSIYIEECTDARFLNIFGHQTDISFLARIWRGQLKDKVQKKLDTVALHDAQCKGYVSIAQADSGEVELQMLQDMRDPVEALVASCTMPGLYWGRPHLGKEEYVDGAFSESIPVHALEQLVQPTSLLVFMNRPQSAINDTGLGIWLYDRYLYWILGMKHHVYAPEKNRRRHASLEYIRTSGKPYCIIYTDTEVGPFTQNSSALSSAADRFEAYVASLITQARA